MADWHRVGQRVVCINDDFDPLWRLQNIATPIINSIYTIREISLWQYGGGETSVAFRLMEIIQKPERWTGPGDLVQVAEMPFAADRFRPVINPEADLAVFESILRGVNALEPVEA